MEVLAVWRHNKPKTKNPKKKEKKEKSLPRMKERGGIIITLVSPGCRPAAGPTNIVNYF